MFNPGDKVYAGIDILSKRGAITLVKKDTEGIVHVYDPRRKEAAVLFVGHLMQYGIKPNQIKLYEEKGNA